MEREDLTYVEKLQNLHILMETRQMLQNKLKEIQNSDSMNEVIMDDLRKIEQEIKEYTSNSSLEQVDLSMTHSLFNPAVIEELDEQ
ncbi:hypothetical protein [Alkalihalobacterium elongatum]|uniref:hypothetical protein n=1 Tax=Alkalihalobacterium elongatum TaxID=2675466 RepID=UPI001C1FF1CE|nr:hypothetical protein [Alkalihalobacterium elongatum]